MLVTTLVTGKLLNFLKICINILYFLFISQKNLKTLLLLLIFFYRSLSPTGLMEFYKSNRMGNYGSTVPVYFCSQMNYSYLAHCP